MIEWIIAISFLLVFFLSYSLTKTWIVMAKRAGLVGKDMNKEEKKDVVEGGGIAVISSFFISVLGYVFVKTFFLKSQEHLIEVFALLLTVSLAGFIGFVDDILGWKIGLKQWQKPLLTSIIAIPLMVINAGNSTIDIPFLGVIDFGIIYPLIIIPIGIIGATNAFNMIAGLNGLEAGMGIIILSTLGFVSYLEGKIWLSLIIFSMVFSLLGFFMLNKFPAKVFPGDSLTYSVGALIAVIAILGYMQKIALFLFLPYFLEFFLKMRGKFKKESFGKVKNGLLYRPYNKIYSITHVFMKGRSEKFVVNCILFIEFIVCVLALILLF